MLRIFRDERIKKRKINWLRMYLPNFAWRDARPEKRMLSMTGSSLYDEVL
uniref:Uncharacterized protein n=1 Tax=Candidatus Kentrum sp. LFY TaxID=2126342 RepID=A0A450WU95_9GAMM|nr:MAG: hypothetical protein BECKLFY1418C_GA0070996_107615 [Candidatus Kentron sp. LFY]